MINKIQFINDFNKRKQGLVFIVCILFLFICFAIFFNYYTAVFQNFVYQADGFLHGSVFYHTLPPTLHDSSVSQGNYYWAPGPLPAIILTPVIALFGIFPAQIYLSIILIIAVILLTYYLAKQEKFDLTNSLWLSFAFVFASIYLGVAMRAHAWQLSSALATATGLLILLEYRNRNRAWLIGLVAAAVLATRVTASLILLVPVIDVLVSSEYNWQKKIKWCTKAITPFFIVGLLLMGLNYARTGNWFDTGYKSAQVAPFLAEVRDQTGLFSIKNIPSNIYYYFLAPPQPILNSSTYQLQFPYIKADIAMGFFFLSPFFLYLWCLKPKERWQKITLSVAGVMTLILLSYYALNAWEFGARYLTDVLPLYYLLLLTCFPDKKIKTRDMALIAFSACLNVYLFTSMPWQNI